MELSIEKLGKVYQDGKVALHDFNWGADQGVFGLLGPNGAGKSTLLEILSLNLMPSGGKILWRGRDIQKGPHRFLSVLGYLPQTYGFYPELKARQFLSYMGGLHGMHGRALRHRIGEILELLNLSDARNRKVKTFSGGMRQRLAIGQALLHRPKILVIDEPTTGLDPGERVGFRNLLFDLGRDCVVLLSTHIVKDVEFSCREMTLLYNGTQRYMGQPMNFISRVEGRVFEASVPIEDFEKFSSERHVIAIHERDAEIDVRFIVPDLDEWRARNKPLESTQDGASQWEMQGSGLRARGVKINLEDAYVDFVRERREQEDTDGTAPEIDSAKKEFSFDESD